MHFLAFSYFFREPKKFKGGNLVFPKYDYEYECNNNSVIIMPGWVEHGVSEVSIENSDYYDGWGRYAITSFINCKEKKKNN
jgi:Rps23 Pro-64 3,4-dihydroxylase Tpa1-like proline 4-hydroxylase